MAKDMPMPDEPTRWIYTSEGKPAYYQVGETIHEADGGTPRFYQAGGWWHPMEAGGKPAFYVNGLWVFTPDGKPAFYYDAQP